MNIVWFVKVVKYGFYFSDTLSIMAECFTDEINLTTGQVILNGFPHLSVHKISPSMDRSVVNSNLHEHCPLNSLVIFK
jgi:hypothetical protein